MTMRGTVARLVAPGVLGLVALATGCTSAEPQDAPTAAIVFPFLDDRFGEAADVLEQRLTAAGWVVEVHGTDGDIPAQVEAVATALDDGVDALVVWPIDPTSLTPVIDEAPEETFVLSFAELVRDTAALDEWVTFDASLAGTSQATTVVDAFVARGGTGPYRIELFAGSPERPQTEASYSAAMAELAPYLELGVMTIGSGEEALDEVTTLRGTDDAAASRMTRILRESYGGGLPDAVLATSDEIARGVAAALLEAGAVHGEGFPVITGRGAQLRALVALLDGRQTMTLLEDPRALAEAAADRVLASAAGLGSDGGPGVDNGATTVLTQFVPPILVHADEIDAIVIESGYWSRAQLAEAIAEYGLPVAPVEPVPTGSPVPSAGQAG